MVVAIIGVVPILALSSTLLPLVKAYSFNIQSTPRQCQNLTVTITGDGGQAPYRLLIIPFGPSPLPNNTEVRRIQDIAFGSGQTTLSFQLRYPENSQFVAVVRFEPPSLWFSSFSWSHNFLSNHRSVMPLVLEQEALVSRRLC